MAVVCEKRDHQPERRASWERMKWRATGPLSRGLLARIVRVTGLPRLTLLADGGTTEQGEESKLRRTQWLYAADSRKLWQALASRKTARQAATQSQRGDRSRTRLMITARAGTKEESVAVERGFAAVPPLLVVKDSAVSSPQLVRPWSGYELG